MKILVCAKTVRYLRAQTGADPRQLNIGPGDLVDMLNPHDDAALEAALRIKDEAPETEISVVSLGGASAEAGLRRALAMGADQACHVFHDDFAALDSWAAANILAAEARTLGFDLILCGQEAIDTNAGLTGPYLAAQLGIPHVSRVIAIAPAPDGGGITAERRLDRGDRETVACAAPLLLAVERDIARARMPSPTAMLAACKRPLERREVAEAPGNRCVTLRLAKPKAKRRAEAQLDRALSAADRARLMMKGGRAAPAPAQNAALKQGCGEDVLDAVERMLIAAGVRVTSP
jgi:electron transfer flavoprotein beta subunit